MNAPLSYTYTRMIYFTGYYIWCATLLRNSCVRSVVIRGAAVHTLDNLLHVVSNLPGPGYTSPHFCATGHLGLYVAFHLGRAVTQISVLPKLWWTRLGFHETVGGIVCLYTLKLPAQGLDL